MNLRHAAALTLVGWYLLSPPIVMEGDKAKVNSSVPLSKWHIARVYETKSVCERMIAKDRATAEIQKDWNNPLGNVAAANKQYVWLKNQRCIASDDPRLAK